jgi:hypothetical protein
VELALAMRISFWLGDAVLATVLVLSTSVPVVVQKMPASGTQGTWTYEDPVGINKFGQYLYTSPMGRDCTRNLTVKVQTPWTCSPGNPNAEPFALFSSAAYFASKECIPAALEGVALLTDQLNGRTGVLQDTCIQLITSHINSNFDPVYDYALDVAEAVQTSPRKHGIVTEGEIAVTTPVWEAASYLGVPVVRTGPWSGGFFMEEPISPRDRAQFRT